MISLKTKISLFLFICITCFSVSEALCQFNIPSPLDAEVRGKKAKTFDLKFELKKQEKSNTLTMHLDLAKGFYIVSPFSKDGFYLNYTITYKEAKEYLDISKIEEFPVAKEEYDPLIEKRVKFVRVSTTYTQDLNPKTKDDFEVHGLVEFLVEPSCIPYDINFTLTQKDGVLSVQNSKPITSSEYKL